MKTHLAKYQTKVVDGKILFKFNKFESVCGEKEGRLTGRDHKQMFIITSYAHFFDYGIESTCEKCQLEYERITKMIKQTNK